MKQRKIYNMNCYCQCVFATQGSKKSFEISPAPKGLESAITLLFTEDCLEFLVKLVETFDQKADEVRILETAVAL
jgi:hypothetical protein